MPAPTVTAASPNFGTLSGGAKLTLTGTNFTGSTGVTIGGVAATDLVVVSATSITITSPAGAVGTASIVVTNGSGSNGDNSLFFYASSTGDPADIYVYLKGGRGDGYVPSWTGAYVDNLVDEKSDPYRDIWPSSASLIFGGGVNTSPLVLPVESSLIVQEGAITVTAPVYSGGIIPGSVIGAVEAKTSDEKNHEPPRQFDKVATWRSYASNTGLWYHFRLLDILGVGSRSRDF